MPITMREIKNTNRIQHAELKIPVTELPGDVSVDQYQQALVIITKVRAAALAHLEVDESDAEITAFDYASDGRSAVVSVVQVAK